MPGFPDYEISDAGTVRRTVTRHSWAAGHVLSPAVTNGYQYVNLTNNGVHQKRYIHRLVLTAFIGEVPGMECNHKNGNKLDNRVSNLEWVTHSQNARHAHDTGLNMNHGETHYSHSRPRERDASGRFI